MKAFGIILLASVVGFFGYQYAYPKLDAWAGFKKLVAYVPNPQPEQKNRTSGFEIPSPKNVPDLPPTPRVSSQEMKNDPGTGSNPAVVETPPRRPDTTSSDDFLPPTFPPIEEVVKGWKEIPKKAFPREVTLLREVEFIAMINGNKIGTRVPSGGKAHALDQNGDKLIVAPTPTSSARVEVALGDTDLQQLLTDAYERWKPSMVAYLRRQWEFKRSNKSNSISSTGSTMLASGKDKPERSADGTYPLLLESMKRGQVTEITPKNITRWGEMRSERIDGQEYFTVIVDYTTKTMFGDFATSAQARIRDGKVVKWIYTGSGEVVP